MGIKYRVQFKAMDGTVYSVNIYDANYSGSIIDLKGGAQPFVTQEDDTEDVFTPIRTQSGYIRIVDDGKDAAGNAFNWRDLIPATATSRPVRLTSTSGSITTVHWAGFIQPRTFTGHYVDSIQEREFPVCCMLTALASYDMEPTNASYQYANFGLVLSYAFSGISGYFSPLTFRFQGGGDVDEWLKKMVSWSLFADKDEDGHLSSKYSCADVVEEVCKFWGWTARVSGMTVYFSKTGNGSWREFGYVGLQNLGIGTSYSAVTVSPTSYSSYPGSYLSTEQELIIARGWRKSKVTASIDKVSSVIEYPTSEIYKILVPEWCAAVTRRGTDWQQYYMKDGPVGYPQDYNCEEVVASFKYGTTTIYGDSVAYNGFPFIWSEYYDGNRPAPRSVSMLQGVALEHSAAQNPDSSHYLMRMKTRNSYWLQDGILVISGNVYNYSRDQNSPPDTIFNGHGSLACSLKIGGKYALITYDGNQERHTSWSNTFQYFSINTGADGQGTTEEIEGQGKILSTRMWYDPYPQYDGYGVPVEGSIGGEIEFCIHEFHDAYPPDDSDPNDQRPVYLMDLKLEFFRKTAENIGNASENDENKYVVTGNTAFTDEKSVDLIFATDNNNSFGRGIVTNADGTYCQTVVIGGNNVRPEQHLVNRMASWGSRTRDMLVLETDGGGGARSMNPLYLVTTGGKTFAPISISHEWRDDKHIVKYVEIDS